jgi:hypothetical protein
MIRGAAAADREGSRGFAAQCFGGIVGCAAILASRASEASKSFLGGNLDAARMQLIDPDVKGLGQSIEAGCGCEIVYFGQWSHSGRLQSAQASSGDFERQ